MIQIRHANVNVECVQYIREGAWLYMKRDATQSTTSVCHTYLLVDYSVSICIYSKEEQCTFRLQVIYSREEQCPFRQQNGLQATGNMTAFQTRTACAGRSRTRCNWDRALLLDPVFL